MAAGGSSRPRSGLDFSKHIQKAEEALRRRNYDFAIELFRQLVDLDADQGEARAGLRRALRMRHDSKKGVRLLRAMAGALPLGRAKTLHRLGRHEACARALEDYLSTNPLDEEANLLLGISLEDAGHFRSAKAVYEFVAEIAPRNPVGLKRAGAMLYRTGDIPGALGYYERALEADPRDQEALKARKNLAAETALSRQANEGVRHSRDLVKNEDEVRRLERRDRRQLSRDDLEHELESLLSRLQESPSDPELLGEIATVHEGIGDLEAALEFAQRALSYRPADTKLGAQTGELQAKVLKRRIRAADKAGDSEQANRLEDELRAFELEDARRRVELRPADGDLRLQLARRLLHAGQLDEAIAELQRCHADPRVQLDTLCLLGQCFQRKGIMDLAKKQLERALEVSDGTGERAKEILYSLGTIVESLGQAAEARSYYVRIYEVDIGYRDVAAKMGELN